MARIMRPLRVLAVFYKAAILTNLEYRANFLFSGLISLMAAGIHVAGVAIFFTHTDTISGWTFEETLIVLGLFIFFDGFIEMVLFPNMREIVRHIREGTMDFILLKPLDSQFQASLQKLNIWKMIELLTGAGIAAYAIAQIDLQVSTLDLITFVVMVLSAVVIIYSLNVIVITISFWFVQVQNVMMLIFTFFDAARYPATVFPSWLRILLTFVVPIAFITTVPAGVLLDRLNPQFVFYSLVIAAGLLFASIRFWRFALRFYGSASS